MVYLFRFLYLGLMIALSVIASPQVFGEERKTGDPYDRGPLFLNKMDIKGSVMNPGIPFQIPWKPPKSVEEGEEIMVRENLQNLLVPLDPEDFEWTIGNHPEGMENGFLGNQGMAGTGEE